VILGRDLNDAACHGTAGSIMLWWGQVRAAILAARYEVKTFENANLCVFACYIACSN
jgi:hypothetical protein